MFDPQAFIRYMVGRLARAGAVALLIVGLVGGVGYTIGRALTAQASTSPAIVLSQAIPTATDNRGICATTTGVIAAGAMTSSQSFVINQSETGGLYSTATIWLDLTDADTSITRLDIVCTSGYDAKIATFGPPATYTTTKNYTPQVCDDVSDGICVLTDAGTWRKASPGTKKFPITLGIKAKPDIKCTVSVGTGAATASVDVLTVDYTLCN